MGAHVNGVKTRAALTLALNRHRPRIQSCAALPLAENGHERGVTGDGSSSGWKYLSRNDSLGIMI